MGKRERKTTASRKAAPSPKKKETKESLIKRLINIFKSIREKKKKGKKLKPRNEFRYNHVDEHPNYVFGEQGNKYKSLGLTHESETFGKKNMPLKNNPQKSDPKQAYIRNGVISKTKKSYSKKTMKDLEFSSEDKANVKSKIRHYKKEQKKRNRSKNA